MKSALYTSLLGIFLLIICIQAKENYCEPKFSCTEGNVTHIHTVCQYGCKPSTGTTPLPNDFKFRNSTLFWHNWYRSQLAQGKFTEGGNDKASNIMVLNYDIGLEFTAACWIYTHGTMENDKCRITPKFGSAGQNLWSGYAGVDNDRGLKHLIYLWFDGYRSTNNDTIEKFKSTGDAVAKFAQLVWANTTHIGCARCSIKASKNYHLVACNYGPAGNLAGEPIYKKGAGASQCPDNLKANNYWTSLCGTTEEWSPDAMLTGTPGLEEELKKHKCSGSSSIRKYYLAASIFALTMIVEMYFLKF